MSLKIDFDLQHTALKKSSVRPVWCKMKVYPLTNSCWLLGINNVTSTALPAFPTYEELLKHFRQEYFNLETP